MSPLKTEIIALSNYADFSKDGKLSINGIFDEIYAHKFPSSFVRGFLAFTITGGEPNKDYTIGVKIQNLENGKEILEKKVNIPAGDKGKGNFVAEMVGLPLPSPGRYLISLTYRGEEIGSTLFNVSTPPQGGGKRNKETIN